MRQRVVSWVATASMILAVVAYYPSAAAFTPAILLSLVAASGALVAAGFGRVRSAISTLAVVVATILVSPVVFPSLAEPRGSRLILGLAVGASVIGIVLFWDFKRRRASA